MDDQQHTASHVSPFEAIKRQAEDGSAYWSARDLSKILDYTLWQKFRNVIQKAEKACENSGEAVSDHFIHTDKMISAGKGAQRKIEDIYLSRYGAYLAVQNGDSSKPIVALGQTYFAVQTRRKELDDELGANIFRATQTDAKLRRDQVSMKEQANSTHYQVGQEVRETIKRLGGTMPEDLPTPAESIQELQHKDRKQVQQRQQPSLFDKSSDDND